MVLNTSCKEAPVAHWAEAGASQILIWFLLLPEMRRTDAWRRVGSDDPRRRPGGPAVGRSAEGAISSRVP